MLDVVGLVDLQLNVVFLFLLYYGVILCLVSICLFVVLHFNHLPVAFTGIRTDPCSESRIEKPHPVYVPRDETFEEIKQDTFSAGRMKALLYNLIPSIAATLSSSDISFKCFSDIDKLYNDGVLLKDEEHNDEVENMFLSKIMKQVLSVGEKLLKYEIPAIIKSMYPFSPSKLSLSF